MSRLVERVARQLAQPGRVVPSVESSETDTALITRRQASRRAAAGALTITAATALGPWTGNAAAEGYCFSECVNNAENNLDQQLDNLRSNLFNRAANFAFWLGTGTNGVTGYLSVIYGQYYEDRAGCHLSKCGDPDKYPPPNRGGGGGGNGGGGNGGGGTQGCGMNCTDCGAAPPGTYCACAGAVCCACGKECSYSQYCVGCCAT